MRGCQRHRRAGIAGLAAGVYRLWRDLGYAVGAILAGVLSDHFGYSAAIAAVAAMTFLSGLTAARLIQAPEKQTLTRLVPASTVHAQIPA